MPDGDLQLLLRTHAGHEPSARELWARFSPRLLAHAGAIVGPDDAHDVVQSVFCGILRIDRGRLARVTDPPAWLALLTRRAALNHLRATRRERARRATGGAISPAPAPDADADDALRRALDALPRRFREVVVLKHVAGLTFDQIALALGLNRNTAAGRYRAALGLLRSQMCPTIEHDPTPAPPAVGVLHG